jgi:hypothetical protein
MAIIPASQLSLMRKRRELKKSVDDCQWDKLLKLEADLCLEINNAVTDPARSPKALMAELGGVIKLYREMSDICVRRKYQHPL